MRARVAVSISAVAMLLVLPQIALGDYTSIQHNLTSPPPDTSFDGSVLRVHQDAPSANVLTLRTGAGQIIGSVTNAAVDLYTNYSHFSPTPEANYPYGAAWFTGGNYSLSFTFTPQGGSPGNYGISGPMDVLKVGVTSASQSLSTVTGEGRWTASSVNLPGPDTWVTGPDGWSGLHTLTLQVGLNLAGWNGTQTFTGGNTLYNISPTANAIPEPSALALLLLGAAGLLRRRAA